MSIIMDEIPPGASVFVLGCGDCATYEHFGGEAECRVLAERLTGQGIVVTGRAVPPVGDGICNPRVARAALGSASEAVSRADVVLLMACPQGEATVTQVTDVPVLPGTQVLVGGPTGGNEMSIEECTFCDECIARAAGGLCPYAFCPKHLLNGPCGGAHAGRCEVYPDRPCVWELIFRRLKRAGRLDILEKYRGPVNFEVSDYGKSGPR